MEKVDWIGLLAVAAVGAGFAALVAWIYRRERGKRAARKELLARLGFVEIPAPPQALLQRLEGLYRRSPGQLFELRALFEKQAPQGSFYFFDLAETSGEEVSWPGAGGLALISPDLKLPRLHLNGRPAFEGGSGGWAAAAAAKMIDWGAGRVGFQRLSLEAYPGIEQKLLVMAQDEAAAREFLSVERLGRLLWLAQAERLSEIDCAGDCLVVRRSAATLSTAALSAVQKDEEIRALVADGERAWVALS